MFTGIISDIGYVVGVTRSGDMLARISTNHDISNIATGASISCSGVCLTVLDKGWDDGNDWFTAQVSDETISKSTLKNWKIGTKINLERALKVGDELGGHFVTGHVDAVAKVLSYKRVKDSLVLEIEIPLGLAQFIARKGSITLDGTSLTVNNVYENSFDVNIIWHTQKQTTLGDVQIGDLLNLEIDPIARYIERYNSANRGNLKLLEG
jgi:riboflavin synthase